MKTRSAARIEFLNDCFVTAFEGGIGYWSATSDYDYQNGTAIVYELDDDNATGYSDTGIPVNYDTIARGVNRISKGTPEELHLHKDYIKDIATANRLNSWDSNMDAIHGDVILQVGLFGRVIYG